jgi:Flp pilus assembly protein TadG
MRSLFKPLARLAQCSSGTALVEMTIIVPLAIALMAGVVDFGMAFSSQATLGKSVRDAARYLAGLPASAYCQTWATDYAKSFVTNVLPTAVPSVDCSTSVIDVTATFPYNSIILTGAMQGFFPAFGNFTLFAQHQEVQVGG